MLLRLVKAECHLRTGSPFSLYRNIENLTYPTATSFRRVMLAKAASKF
jgi:hypothetical protein